MLSLGETLKFSAVGADYTIDVLRLEVYIELLAFGVGFSSFSYSSSRVLN
jgi:hypothetical protein